MRHKSKFLRLSVISWINHTKSEFMGINLDSDVVDSMATSFGCKRSSWPSTYLGLPLYGKPYTSHFWEPIIENVERLNSWKGSHISKGAVLLCYRLHSTTYQPVSSLFKIPAKTAGHIEKLHRNFLWNDQNAKRGIHSIRWHKVQLPLYEGGLNLIEMRVKNKSLLAKWVWRY